MNIHTASIDNAASLSGAVTPAGETVIRIDMPAAWTAAVLSFQTSFDGGTTWRDVVKDDGTEYTLTVAQGKSYPLLTRYLLGYPLLKVRSGTSGSPVVQGGARSITLVTVPTV